MKMSRSQIKALVKECLIELLSEGLGNIDAIAQQTPRPTISGVAESRSRKQQQKFDPRLDTPVSQGRSQTNALKEAIKREAGGNPIMESIFADTAMTTLPSQLSHGDVASPHPGRTMAPPGVTQQEQFVGAPEDVFGEDTTSRWANLAFMDAQPKKTA